MADSAEDKRLMVIILDQPQLLDDLLTGFLDLGVPGATIVETRGMGEVIRTDMPVFAGLAALFPENTGTRMVMSVLPAALVEPVLKLVDEIVEGMDGKQSAVCFTLPVDRFSLIRK
jgi:nitrogen regulatory protein PII